MEQNEFFDKVNEASKRPICGSKIGNKDYSNIDPYDGGPSEDAKVMSREEQEKERQERLEKMITPELLTHFFRNEAKRLVEYFDRIPSAQTCGPSNMYSFERLSKEANDFLRNELQWKKIIELGSAGRNEAKLHFEYDFKVGQYEYADPQYNTDGLSHLMKQPDNSAIVTSFGVLEDGVLYMDGLIPGLRKYTELLGKEIYRVTPKGAITFHGLETDHDLIDAGFKQPKDIPKDFNKKLIGWNFLKVLRK